MTEHRLTMTTYLGRPECRPHFACESSQWTGRRTGRPGNTMSTARNESRHLINLLRRSPHWPGVEALANRLQACAPNAPCFSGPCPVCNLAAQRAHVDFVGRALKKTSCGMVMVTIVNSRELIPVGKLLGHALYVKFRENLADVLTKLQLQALGGFELSQNWDEAERYLPHYAEQAHFICPFWEKERVRAALKERFSSIAQVLRPVKFIKYDLHRAGAAYNTKNKAQKRIALLKTPGRTHSSKWRRLGSEGRVEVALAQDAAGLDANSFSCGFELQERRGRAVLKRLR